MGLSEPVGSGSAPVRRRNATQDIWFEGNIHNVILAKDMLLLLNSFSKKHQAHTFSSVKSSFLNSSQHKICVQNAPGLFRK